MYFKFSPLMVLLYYRRTKKKPPRSPPKGVGTTGSNFSDNTSKYLGSVYTEYVREMDEPVAVGRGGEASDLALEMQHEFNMKLAETIEKEQQRQTPVYAEVRAAKKKGRSHNGSYKSDLFASEDIDATIDAAFKATFEDEDRHMSPVMGTEAILEKKSKKETSERDEESLMDRVSWSTTCNLHIMHIMHYIILCTSLRDRHLEKKINIAKGTT